MSSNRDAAPGRTEEIIRLSRKLMGDNFTIYLDANSSYSPEKAIEVGAMLEEYGIDLFEEPVHWLDFEGTKRVADALSIPVGWGEQDYDWYKFKWLLEHGGVDVLQPDVFYNGGIIRTLRIASLAAGHNIPLAPHSPKSGPAAGAMLHLVSLIDNPHLFQEFHIDPAPVESWYTPNLSIAGGILSVPDGPGLGFEYDPDYIGFTERVL